MTDILVNAVIGNWKSYFTKLLIFIFYRFVCTADEDDEGAGLTHKTSLLLAHPHSAFERQQHSRYTHLNTHTFIIQILNE